MPATALCPRCHGGHEFDEDGRLYTCYFCGDTGMVSAEVAAEVERAEIDFAEKFAPVRLGIFFSQQELRDLYECGDFDMEPRAGRRMFTRLLPAVRQPVVRQPVVRQPVVRNFDFSDDIPF